MLRLLRALTRVVFILVILGAISVGGFIAVTMAQISAGLPDFSELVDYVPATGSKVYAGDGSLMIALETEHRIPVAIGKVPRTVIQAFLAAEDRDFYNHRGVDPAAILRAAMSDVLRLQHGQRPIGASTITQQVVRHFLLTNEVSVTRKIKEALLAYRIERTLSKDRILEIYLNEIYLGAGAYGIAAAADTYFQKPLDRLTLAEAAFLAALPKAPNNYNPTRHPEAALARRDWVLSGMADLGWVSAADAKAAMAQPLGVHLRGVPQADQAIGESGYFAEEVRRELVARFGEKAVYEGGLRVRTSYAAADQQMAETAFRHGLVEYDARHGWRGPLAHLANGAAARGALAGMADPPAPAGWRLAAVTAADAGGATIALKSGGAGYVPLTQLRWARRTLEDQRLGAAVRRAGDVLTPGDIVLVEPVAAAAARLRGTALPVYALRQIPDVSGGVVVMDPKSGRVLAVVGGWSFRQSQFDRATQAKRQPGSAFKPFVYVTALENGFLPSSTVEDSPVSIPQGPGLAAWQPANYEGNYVGATTLEDALVHSRNLATVHVAMTIGLPPIAKTARNFDILDKMPLYYSMALGAGETTLLRLTGAYAMLDNGGHWLLPSVIDLVQDRTGRILYQKGVGACAACFVAAGSASAPDSSGLYRASGAPDPAASALPGTPYADNAVLYKPTKPDPLVTPDADAEIVAMMQGVVQHGTGIAVAAVGKPLAGKTGTTSDWYDAWFVGFSPDLVAGVYVGFDDPRTLGEGEAGGHVAAPIFRDFMAAALKGKPATPFPLPAGAAPLVASAGPGAMRDNAAEQDDDEVNAARDAAADRDGSGGGYGARAGASEPDDDAAASEPAARRWPGYGAPRPRSYAAAPAPNYYGAPGSPYAAPYYAAPGYAAPGYPAPRVPGYAPPPYGAPGWTSRPAGYGTGGLY